MPIEIETKLRIPDSRALDKLKCDPHLTAVRMDDFRETDMCARYYDTPEHTLNERKWTLRLRKENGESIAVFKHMGNMEDNIFQREEFSCAADSLEEGLSGLVERGAPPELLDMGPFVERCRIEFTRTSCSLRLEDGSCCELALDAGDIYADSKKEPLMELELELLTGQPEEMAALALALKSRYNLQTEFYSKYARALRLLRTR